MVESRGLASSDLVGNGRNRRHIDVIGPGSVIFSERTLPSARFFVREAEAIYGTAGEGLEDAASAGAVLTRCSVSTTRSTRRF